MKSINGEWQKFSEEFDLGRHGEKQLSALKSMYFAGSYGVLKVLTELIEKQQGPEEWESTFLRMWEEINEFKRNAQH